MTSQTLFIGGKIKKLRRARNINQKTLAGDLGISPSYLNLIERNRRGLTVALLLKISELFALDFSELSRKDDVHLASDLMELFGDGLFSDFDLTNKDIQDLAVENPEIGKAFIRLYDSFKSGNKQQPVGSNSKKIPNSSQVQSHNLSSQKTEQLSEYMSDIISDFLQNNNNYFPTLEKAAIRIRSDTDLAGEDLFQDLKTFGLNAFGLQLRFSDLVKDKPYVFLKDTNTLTISNYLALNSQLFHLARCIGQLSAQHEINKIIETASFENEGINIYLESVLGRYIGASIMMPYDDVLRMARKTRYDVDILCRYFNASFEQICHRLTTLQKPGAKGIPFHFIRTDIAGNISKRFSSSGIQISRYGGACPRWNIYTAFMQPGQINVQISEMPDGQVYFCIARSITKGLRRFGAPLRHFSIGLGCKYIHAKSLVYSDAIDLKNSTQVIPIGVNCRICPRADCSERAFPLSLS